ncbi:MAG: hypothetical protein LBS22_02480 [Puniceicoccales bacterium]|nr:hypothetical protein [Puniceicoccales bacterium]
MKKGTNVFNEKIFQEDIRAAKVYEIGFIRLTLDKFPSTGQDFLMGNANCYEHLNGDDLALLKKILGVCVEEDMPVIITMLGLPGSRWKQLNGDNDDLRIWQDTDFQRRAARFWKDLARELRDYEIVVGYTNWEIKTYQGPIGKPLKMVKRPTATGKVQLHNLPYS